MTYLILFLAVIIGALIGEFVNIKENYKKLFLTFSGAFLLAVTVFHLLPEAYEGNSAMIGIFIMFGVFIQILLEFISKGIEHAHSPGSHDHSHGHSHDHSHGHSHDENNGHIQGITIAMFVSLCVHAFMEGAPIHSHNHEHEHNLISELFNPVLLGIFIHKIPIASILYLSFRSSKYSVTKSLLLLFLFAAMTPAGAYLSANVGFLVEYSQYINAVVIGIFLHISTIILFESSSDHKFNAAKLLVIILATLIVFWSY